MMLTSQDFNINISTCQQSGISAYMIKPVRQAELLREIVRLLGGDVKKAAPTQTRAAKPRQVRPLLNVLLAEDNLVNQKLAVKLLERKGHVVAIAENGREALNLASQKDFDVILMDVQMPEMDGLDATQAIRKRELSTGKHVPIIAMTAHVMKGDEERCLAIGMDGYVAKPIDVNVLMDTIYKVVQSKQETTVSQS